MNKNNNEFNFQFFDKLMMANTLMKCIEFKLKDPTAEHMFTIYFKKLRNKDGLEDFFLKSTDVMYLDIPDINIPFPFKKRS